VSSVSNASPSVVRAFNLIARVYDNPAVQRVVYRPNHDAVVGALRKYDARRVVDVGCGTGILAARIQAELRPEVVYGCDPSAGMLAKARRRSSAVSWIQASADRLPFSDAAVDAVVTTEAFQFFDQPSALREFHRVLAPGGHAVIAMITPALRPPRALTERLPARWHTMGGIRALLGEAGFEVLEQRRVRPLPLWPGVATVAVKPA
jgi:ubiquinone/menaquinone biosynthesis C-methylase UbiE